MAHSSRKYPCPKCSTPTYIEFHGGQKASWSNHDNGAGKRCEKSGKKIPFPTRYIGR